MKKLLHFSFTLFLIGFSHGVFAQCADIMCPDDLMVELFDPCDESSTEIEDMTGFPHNSAGSGFFIEAEFLDAIGSNGEDGACIGDEQYSYIDDPIDISSDCQGDGYYASFIRTWSVFDAGGIFIEDCPQTIELIDNTPPMEQIDLVAFFEDQDPLGAGWDNLVLECPEAVTWNEPDLGIDITDNCSPGNGITMTSNFTPPTQLADGLNVIEYIFTDGCGIETTVTWDIFVTCVVPCMGADIFEDCNDPPIECDLNEINGFMSCTPDYNGGTFGDLCNGQGAIHNASYFSFVAGSEDIGITVGVSDCLGTGNGTGVQANIIDPCDPNTCYGDSGANCQTTQFSFNATGLTIGNVYQLVVDGCNGDECAYTVTIDSAPPFAIPDPEDPVAIVEDPSSCVIDVNDIVVCPGTIVTLYPENFLDAQFFFCWEINNNVGVTVQNNDTDCPVAVVGQTFACSEDYSTCGPLELEFGQEGSYEVCLTEMSNGCDTQPQSGYCFNIEVVLAVDQDFGSFDVCEVELPFFNVPNSSPSGETWQGANGSALVAGMNTFDVEDDCDCNYTQMLELNILPVDDIPALEYSVCGNDVNSFVDPVYGIDWDYISTFGPGPNLFENVLIEGGSAQIDWEGNACAVNVTYLFDIYDIPGSIVQVNGSACDANLSFDIDDALFPMFMDDGDIGYSWADAGGNVVGLTPSVSVTTAGTYTLTMTYAIDGETCSYTYSENVDLTGSTPGMPTFISNPTATCEGETTGLIYSVTPSASSTFSWSATNGNITGGQGTDAITVDVIDSSMPMTIMVFASTPGCGDSPMAMETLAVTPSPVVTLPTGLVVCAGEVIDIPATLTAGTASTYNWTAAGGMIQGLSNTTATLQVSWTTPGPQTVSLSVADAGGCESAVVDVMVDVQAALMPPVATCTVVNSNTITIEWTDVIPGETTVTSTMPGTQTGTSYTVDNLSAGTMVTFTLVTNGGTSPCGDSPASTVTCETSNCNVTPMISIDPVYEDFCMNGSLPPVQVASTPAGGTWSGAVDMNGMFDPSQAVPGPNVIMYEYFDPVQNCPGSTSLTVEAYEVPDPTFTLSTEIACIGEPITITYAGIPGSATNWDYDTGASMPMNIMPSQFDIVYNTSGQKIINLEVANGPCMVEADLPVQIFPAVPPPVLSCNPTTNSVAVSWDDIPDVSMYEIEITTPSGTINTSQSTTSIPVDGLNAGDDVTVTVTAIDPNGCANPSSSCMTTAQDCPVYMVALDVIDTGNGGASQCWDPTNPNLITPSAIVSDDAGNDVTAAGTGVWSGPTGVDPMTGIFIAPGPSAVPYTLAYNYTDATGCPGIATVDVNIFDEPNSEFTTDIDNLCVGEAVEITIDDFAPGSTYDLIVDADASAYTQTDNTDGTYTILFTDDPGGDVDITLQTFAGNCMSPISETTVAVVAAPEFSIVDLVECYNVDTPIELEVLDTNGDLVAGQWVVENEGPLPGAIFAPTINNTTYNLTFTEANCGEEQSIEIEVIEKPTLQITAPTVPICFGETIEVTIETNNSDELSIVGLNGTPDDPALFSGIYPNITFLAPGPGTYSYESVVDLAGDCDSDVITWEIVVEDEPDMPMMEACVSTLNSIEFSWTAVPCAESYDVVYYNPAEVIVGPVTGTSYTVEDLEEGDEIEIIVNIISSCACPIDPITQTCNAEACDPAGLEFGDELDGSFCESDPPAPITLTATVDIDDSGDFTFSSDDCDCIDADGNIDFSGLAAGNYTVDVNYALGDCNNYNETMGFTIEGAPVLAIDTEPAPCEDVTTGSINISASGVGPFEYSSGGETFAEGQTDGVDVGEYTIMVTDLGTGCTAEETVTLDQLANPIPNIFVPDEALTEFEQTFTFDMTPNPEQVIWTVVDSLTATVDCATEDCSTFNFTPLGQQVYTVAVEAFFEDGACSVRDTFLMEAEELQITSIFIPNIFNPNDVTNPINQTLDMYIEGTDLVINDFVIYDRWGNAVHRGDDNGPNQVIGRVGADEDIITLWDGTFSGGNDFVPGVYIYLLEIEITEDDDRTRTEFITGSVTIVD